MSLEVPGSLNNLSMVYELDLVHESADTGILIQRLPTPSFECPPACSDASGLSNDDCHYYTCSRTIEMLSIIFRLSLNDMSVLSGMKSRIIMAAMRE